ncbi:MAG: radical SAM protein [Deltaproteobacteria bacterium]|nr:radical SAM protein [Deltaproteobacteria bacterium]
MELTLFVDHECNLRCTYCYNGDKFTRRMSSDTMRKAVALALDKPSARLHVAFFGGEPLLHPDFVKETVDHVDQAVAELAGPRPDLLFLMNTNATLIDDDAIALMAPPHEWSVFVSLDGPQDVHDQYRIDAGGAGTFDAVVAGLERLRAASIPFGLLAVVNPETAPRLGDTLRTIFSLGPQKVALSANFRAPWTEEAIAALRQGLGGAGDALMDLFRSGVALEVDPFQSKILAHLKRGMPCPGRCLLGDSAMTVAPSGRIYACGEMVGEDQDATLAFGHVDTGLDQASLARMRAAKDRVEEICSPCELRDRCQSQCGCRHVALTGKLGEITETLCEIETAFIDESDRIAETLVAEKCQAFIDYFYRRPWGPDDDAVLTQLRRARDE